MQGSALTQAALNEQYSVKATTRAWLECSYNDFSDTVDFPSTSTIYGSFANATEWRKYFPPESVIKSHRPIQGHLKNLYSDRNRYQSDHQLNSIAVMGNNQGQYYTLDNRVYLPNAEAKYQYFVAPAPFTLPVVYSDQVTANKIVIGFEKGHYYDPTLVNIYVDIYDAGSWTQVYANPVADANGRAEIWLSDTGVWTQVKPLLPKYEDAAEVDGVRIRTTYTSTASLSRLQTVGIIELGLSLCIDATKYLVSWSTQMTLDENDRLMPIGTVSANTADVTFDNSDQIFENDLTMLTRENVKINLQVNYGGDRQPDQTVIGGEWIDVYTGFIQNMKTTETDATTTAFDIVTFLQQETCPEIVLKRTNPMAAIWRLLDTCGYTNIRLRWGGEQLPTINYFWTSKENKVWDVIRDVCATFQMAVFVDEQGYINIASNGYLFDQNNLRSTDFEVNYAEDEDQIPNLFSATKSPKDIINKVTLTYQLASSSHDIDPSVNILPGLTSKIAFRRSATRVLWQPDTVISLGIAYLAADLTSTATDYMLINASAFTDGWGATSGYLVVDNEAIKYGGSQFKYQSVTLNAPQTVTVRDENDFSNMIADAEGSITFTGKLMDLTRGQLGSAARSHSSIVDSFTYANKQTRSFYRNGGKAFLRLSNTSTSPTYNYATDTVPYTSSYIVVATRLKVNSPRTSNNSGGLLLGPNGSNPHLQLRYEDATGKKDAATLSAIFTTAGGTTTLIKKVEFPTQHDQDLVDAVVKSINSTRKKGTKPIKRRVIPGVVTPGDWHTLRVFCKPTGKKSSTGTAYYNYNVEFDGDSVMEFDYGTTPGHTMGLFAYKDSSVNFDYLAAGKGSSSRNIDYSYYTEFNPSVKQIYYNRVTFSKGPALTVQMYGTPSNIQDPTQNLGPYIPNAREAPARIKQVSPFEAIISVENRSDDVIVLSEDDSSLYPLVYGNIVERSDDLTATYTNDDSIKMYGEKAQEFTAAWIQNEPAARQLAEWVVNTTTADKYYDAQVEAFGNALIQVGDIINVGWPERNFGPDDRYVVRGIANGWDNGLTTTLDLLRI